VYFPVNGAAYTVWLILAGISHNLVDPSDDFRSFSEFVFSSPPQSTATADGEKHSPRPPTLFPATPVTGKVGGAWEKIANIEITQGEQGQCRHCEVNKVIGRSVRYFLSKGHRGRCGDLDL
jgi:hypothetical protein